MAQTQTYGGFTYEQQPDGSWKRGAPVATAAAPIATAIALPRSAAQQAKDARDAQGASNDQARTDIAVRGEGRDVQKTAFDQTSTLRKEFLGLPSVETYNVALGTFNSALRTGPNAQGDQSLITSYAKMLDPTSAVLGGEFQTTASTQSMIDQIKAKLGKEIGAGGMLTPKGRAAIRSEMRNLVTNRFKPAYDRDREQYSEFASRTGVDPYMIIGEDAAARYPKNLLAAPGASTKMGDLPPAYQQAYDAFIKQGNFTPQQYAAFRTGLDQAFFPDAADQTATYLAEGENILKNGGKPGGGGVIPGVEQPMGTVQSLINTDAGAGAAAYFNAAGAGLPSLLGGVDKMEALSDAHPKSAFAGEILGGVTGAALTGGTLGAGARLLGGARVAPLVANPITADGAYGAAYGATQDSDNMWRGAGVGALGGLGGAMAGRALGNAAPRLFNRAGVNAADAAVPTNQELRTLAGQQYQAAEQAGEAASETGTQQLADQTQQILAREGRITPRGNLIDVNNPIARANMLIQDFAGAPMTPTQAQSVRGVLGDGLQAMDNGAPDRTQRRLAGMMMDNFDEWADPVLPNVAQARETASRYLQGEEISRARDIADANTSWFTQSGPENALRNSFRYMDRSAIRGQSRQNDLVQGAVENVTRGDGLGNAARRLGKFAPTSALSALPALTLGGAVGAGSGGLLGTIAAAGLAGAGIAGRAVATARTQRAAEVAELIARGGQDYVDQLNGAITLASRRAGIFGRGVGAVGASQSSR